MHSISRFIYPKINYFKNEIKKKGRESLQFLLCVNSFQYLPGGGNSKSVLRGEGRTASKFPESSYRGWNDFLVATPWIKQLQLSRRWVFWTRPGREQKVPPPCAHRHFPARKSLEAYPSAHTCCAPAQRRTDASGGSVQSPNAHPRPAPGGVYITLSAPLTHSPGPAGSRDTFLSSLRLIHSSSGQFRSIHSCGRRARARAHLYP